MFTSFFSNEISEHTNKQSKAEGLDVTFPFLETIKKIRQASSQECMFV